MALSADFWDRRADAFNDRRKDAASGNLRADFVDWIARYIPMEKVESILDIGCGTGHHVLGLGARKTGAGQVCRIEGCDIAPKMIALAKENAARISGASFRVLDWDRADLQGLGWERAFDLVLAIRTPALGCKADLDRIIAASKGYCVVITEAHKASSVREALKEVLPRSAVPDRASAPLYCLVNILWLMGYYPEISYLDYGWEADWSLEDTLALHQDFFERKQTLAAHEREALVAALEGMAVGGRVHEQVSTKVALVAWAVGKRAVV